MSPPTNRAGASAAAAALAAACSWPDPGQTFSTAGGASGSADVCSCRAAAARCMFCRGGEAADSGGLEHVSCGSKLAAGSNKNSQEPEREREGGLQARWCNNSSVVE